MTKSTLLGININRVGIDQAVELIETRIKSKGESMYVVTPNVEMIVAAQNDLDFKVVLNSAQMAIPDSGRLGWGLEVQNKKNFLIRLLLWPFFLLPSLLPGSNFPVVTGVDLMEKLIQESAEKGYRVGFLGGFNNVAIKVSERLIRKHPTLKIEFIQENLHVDQNGDHKFFDFENLIGARENKAFSDAKEHDFYDNLNSRKLDLLFIAFGHPKQEKWMYKNLHKLNAKVMLGVGGAFDYLSGQVERAPNWMRRLGFEWLFRFMQQPWRIFRFGSLVKFTFLVLFSRYK